MTHSNQFAVGDLLYSYTLDYDENGAPTITKEIKAKVTGYDSKGKLEVEILQGFKYINENIKGTRFVKVGNDTNEFRQSGIFIDSITINNPRIVIYDDVDEIGKIFNQSTYRFIAGNLGEIIDADFQPLGDHYLTVDGLESGKPLNGIVSDYAFLRGKLFTKEGGRIGGFSVTQESSIWFLRSGSGPTSVGLSDGDYAFFAGNANPSDSKAWIKNTGEAQFKNVAIDEGSYVKTTTLRDVENIPFIKGIVFSVNEDDKIAWTAGTITLSGTEKTIVSGTALTVNDKYIIWVSGNNTFTLSETIPVLDQNTYLMGYKNDEDEIIASSFMNVIYADLINVSTLSAITANIGEINAGSITGVTLTGTTIKTSNDNERVELSTTSDILFYSDGSSTYRIGVDNTSIFIADIINNMLPFYYLASTQSLTLEGTTITLVGDIEILGTLKFNGGIEVNNIESVITDSNTSLPTSAAVKTITDARQPTGVLLGELLSTASIDVLGKNTVGLTDDTPDRFENLINAVPGQSVTLFNEGTSSITIVDSGNFKMSGDCVMGQYDTLTLKYINDTINWIEISRSNN